MEENIDKEFLMEIEELENGWIKTEHGIFTPNEESNKNAYEVYEEYLYNLNNPPIPVPSLEEVVEEQGNKISILTDNSESQSVAITGLQELLVKANEENEALRNELAMTQDAINELLFMTMNLK